MEPSAAPASAASAPPTEAPAAPKPAPPTEAPAAAPPTNAEGKRPAEASAIDDSKKPRFSSDDWLGAPSNGGAAQANPRAEAERREETRSAVSSIKSKLSKPKSSSSWQDDRKTKHGSFSAGLTREQILKSQQAHREKAEAAGKPVPYYQRPK